MKSLLIFLISSALILAKASSADTTTVLAAHVVALKAFRNAISIDVKGTAVDGVKEGLIPVLIPIDVTVTEKKTIREIRDFFISAGFQGTKEVYKENKPGSSNVVLRFVITSPNNKKVTFHLIEGDVLRIPQFRESISTDPKFIFPLDKLLLHTKEKDSSNR